MVAPHQTKASYNSQEWSSAVQCMCVCVRECVCGGGRLATVHVCFYPVNTVAAHLGRERRTARHRVSWQLWLHLGQSASCVCLCPRATHTTHTSTHTFTYRLPHPSPNYMHPPPSNITICVGRSLPKPRLEPSVHLIWSNVKSQLATCWLCVFLQ